MSSSTPRMAVASQSSNTGTSTFSMSLGLASILNERDLADVPRQGTPPRATPHAVSSNPARFPSLISESPFNPVGMSSPATTLTLPTNSYNLIPSPSTSSERSNKGQGLEGRDSKYEYNTTSSDNLPAEHTMPNLTLNLDRYKRNHNNTSVSSGNSETTVSGSGDVSALGVINRLRNTGFSLYGYLARTSPNGNTTSANTDVSRPSSLPVNTTSVSTVTLPSATIASSSVAMASRDDDQSVMVVRAGEAPSTESGRMSHLTSFLARKTAGSVIGAFTKFGDRPF